MSQRVICQGRDSGSAIREVALTTSGAMEVASSTALTVNLPSGAATESSLSSIDTKIPSKGSATGANSLPVVIASDQGSLTVGLPTNAAQEDTLTAMSAKLPASLGQKAMSASMSVAIASDQSAISVSSTASGSSTTQTLTVSGTSTGTSTALDTDGFGRVGYVIQSDTDNVVAQIQFSHDNSTYYQVESGKTVVSVNDASGSNPKKVTYFSQFALAKYVRVQVYNPAATSASIVVLANRITT